MHEVEWRLFQRWRDGWTPDERLIFDLQAGPRATLEALPKWKAYEAAAWVMEVDPSVVKAAIRPIETFTGSKTDVGFLLKKDSPVLKVVDFFERLGDDRGLLEKESALSQFYAAFPSVQRVCEEVKEDSYATKGEAMRESIRGELRKMGIAPGMVPSGVNGLPGVRGEVWEAVQDLEACISGVRLKVFVSHRAFVMAWGKYGLRSK